MRVQMNEGIDELHITEWSIKDGERVREYKGRAYAKHDQEAIDQSERENEKNEKLMQALVERMWEERLSAQRKAWEEGRNSRKK